MTTNGQHSGAGRPKIDREALRARYREERDKRLRPDGNDQYLQPTGRFASLLEDPYVAPTPREPRNDEIEVAFIGGGFAGLVTGGMLKEAGVDDVVIIEAGGDFGGVWYWNRYPGAMCDTAAMIYLPLLEETGHMPSQKYVFAPEIFEHARRIGRHYGLYERALFSTEVTRLSWDEEARRWTIETNRGDRLRARFVAMGTGPLHRPKLPGIPGIDRFQGHCFHTSRWDYDYTGGSPDGDPMTGLADKRVGIIGTGATAVQCIPALGRDAKELFVFQRTPSSIDVRNNHAIDQDWFATLEPGWQQKWLTNFAILQTGGFADEDLVKDGWTDISQRIRDRVVEIAGTGEVELGPALFLRAYEESDDEKMCEIRDRVDAIVEDPATAEALKPWYRQLCKRPCFHDEYLQTYNRPTVQLVDTGGKGVEAIDETGVVVGGRHYELDCIVYASGFEVGTEYARRSGYETVGRDGETLTEHWAGGMRSLHGIHVHGFPNLFIVGISQAGNLISNVTMNYVDAGRTIATIVSHAAKTGADTVETTAQAEDDWVEMLERGLEEGGRGALLGNPECTPGYYNNEGKALTPKDRWNAAGYPEGPVAYFEYIARWRTAGDFAGLEFGSSSEAEPAGASSATS